jgi:hypothetical protein
MLGNRQRRARPDRAHDQAKNIAAPRFNPRRRIKTVRE